MRKLLLVFIALIGCILTIEAQTSYERTTGTQDGNLRKMNRQSHFATTKTIVKTAAQALYADAAPENSIETPFSHDLGKNSDVVDIVKQYTSINVNNDDRSWKIATVNNYSACMPPKAEDIEVSIFSP